MQQTHGNRAVQRQISSTPLPVQRMTEEEALAMIKNGPLGSMMSDEQLAEAAKSQLAKMANEEAARAEAVDILKEGPFGAKYSDEAIEQVASQYEPKEASIVESTPFDFVNKLGYWRDEDGNWRIGHKQGVTTNKTTINKGGDVSGDYGGYSASYEANVGSDGATIGVQGNAGDGSVTRGGPPSKDSNTDEQTRFGLSVGEGGAGRLHWGDADKDGYREYGFGVDVGPLSYDFKSEDPTGLRGLNKSLGPALDMDEIQRRIEEMKAAQAAGGDAG
jgi:hypothetical protein